MEKPIIPVFAKSDCESVRMDDNLAYLGNTKAGEVFEGEHFLYVLADSWKPFAIQVECPRPTIVTDVNDDDMDASGMKSLGLIIPFSVADILAFKPLRALLYKKNNRPVYQYLSHDFADDEQGTIGVLDHEISLRRLLKMARADYSAFPAVQMWMNALLNLLEDTTLNLKDRIWLRFEEGCPLCFTIPDGSRVEALIVPTSNGNIATSQVMCKKCRTHWIPSSIADYDRIDIA